MSNKKGVFMSNPDMFREIRNKSTADMRHWIEANFGDVSFQDPNNGLTLIWVAADHKGNARVAEVLISMGADVNAKNTEGGTPLQQAVLTDDPEMVKVLVSHGADVNAKEYRAGVTALHYTALAKENVEIAIEIAKILVSSGADINAKDNRGSTPLDLAKVRGTAMVQYLSSVGAK
jgi:ankyrin repeat protein